MPLVAMNDVPGDLEGLKLPGAALGDAVTDAFSAVTGALSFGIKPASTDQHTDTSQLTIRPAPGSQDELRQKVEERFTRVENNGGREEYNETMNAIRVMIDKGQYDAAWMNLASVEKWMSAAPATSSSSSTPSTPASTPKTKTKTKTDSGNGSNALDWFSAITKAGTAVAPVVLNKNKKQKPAGGGGGFEKPKETPWGTYAMIGGGVLLLGVAIFAATRSSGK